MKPWVDESVTMGRIAERGYFFGGGAFAASLGNMVWWQALIVGAAAYVLLWIVALLSYALDRLRLHVFRRWHRKRIRERIENGYYLALYNQARKATGLDDPP